MTMTEKSGLSYEAREIILALAKTNGFDVAVAAMANQAARDEIKVISIAAVSIKNVFDRGVCDYIDGGLCVGSSQIVSLKIKLDHLEEAAGRLREVLASVRQAEELLNSSN